MALVIPDPTRNAMADAVTALVDADAAAGKLRIYDSAVDDPLGNLLVEITLNDPAFTAAASGQAALDTTSLNNTADLAGAAQTAVVFDGADVEIYRGAVTTSGGGGDFLIDDVNIGQDDIVQVNSHSITVPTGP